MHYKVHTCHALHTGMNDTRCTSKHSVRQERKNLNSNTYSYTNFHFHFEVSVCLLIVYDNLRCDNDLKGRQAKSDFCTYLQFGAPTLPTTTRRKTSENVQWTWVFKLVWKIRHHCRMRSWTVTLLRGTCRLYTQPTRFYSSFEQKANQHRTRIGTHVSRSHQSVQTNNKNEEIERKKQLKKNGIRYTRSLSPHH